MRDRIVQSFRDIQNEICTALEQLDGQSVFEADIWERPGGGGGESRIIQDGAVYEKGGVNFSAVHGDLPETVLKEFGVASSSFFATGVSIVLHPHNPWVPIVHMNIRYFEMPGEGLSWFGGGIDLTPHYVNREEATHFHRTLKTTCDQFHPGYYPKFKTWADNYFYIRHRKETRGIGGIFFDRLSEGKDLPMDQQFDFVTATGRTFLPAYLPIARANKDRAYTEAQKNWQLMRRGRYVEFNLVYDRGTHFGLQTDGRVESILMSLPALASWKYNFQPPEGSTEAETLQFLTGTTAWL
jgi:coproporphyrinogen III oxidase